MDSGEGGKIKIDRIFILYDDGSNNPLVFTYPPTEIDESVFSFTFDSYDFYAYMKANFKT